MSATIKKLFQNKWVRVFVIYLVITMGATTRAISQGDPWIEGFTVAMPITYLIMVIAIFLAAYKHESEPNRIHKALKRTRYVWLWFAIWVISVTLFSGGNLMSRSGLYTGVWGGGYVTLAMYRILVNLKEMEPGR